MENVFEPNVIFGHVFEFIYEPAALTIELIQVHNHAHDTVMGTNSTVLGRSRIVRRF